MHLLRGTAFLGLLCASTHVAWGQGLAPALSDTTLRAAYCVGVLKQSMANLSTPISAEGCETNWSKLGLKSTEECRELNDLANKIARDLRVDYEARRKRYAQYVALRSLEASSQQKTVILAVIRKGETDTTTKEDASLDPATVACYSHVGDALVACVAIHDPTHANILRCQHVGDQLPF
jgi:hypothetical protein